MALVEGRMMMATCQQCTVYISKHGIIQKRLTKLGTGERCLTPKYRIEPAHEYWLPERCKSIPQVSNSNIVTSLLKKKPYHLSNRI
jgi:hypothetical protein